MLRVGLRALLHTGDMLVEVEGVVLVSPRTRFSDTLSAPDQLQEVLDATITRHLPAGSQSEQAPLISINRDRILLATVEEGEGGGEPGMRIELDSHQVRLLCPGFDVSGTLRTPIGGSPYTLVTTGGGRFVGMTDAEVKSSSGKTLSWFAGKQSFCLVNRASVQVVIGIGSPAPAPA